MSADWWGEWQEATIPDLPELAGRPPDRVVVNKQYEVWIWEGQEGDAPGWPAMVWLSIKRRKTKDWIRDWRHLQRIKNELVGPECEGVELFPAESRLVDTSNQYHLFCIRQPGIRFPFGFQARAVVAFSSARDGSRQRSFEPGQVPDDALRTQADFDRAAAAAMGGRDED